MPRVLSMIIGALALTLRLPTCHSLKDKRSIVKSVGSSAVYGRTQLNLVVDWVYENRPDVDVVQSEIDLF